MARRPWLDEIFGSVVISLSVKNWATVCGKVVSRHYGSRKVRDAGGRVQRLAGVRDRKDNELSGQAGDCGY
jgi:hypothetical protein